MNLTLLIAILGSVALLLWGLRTVRFALEDYFPDTLDRLALKLGRNRFAGALGGAATGAGMQSGSAVVVLAARLADRGRLALPVALAIALGADFGSAFAAVILAQDVAFLVPMMFLLGVVLFSVSRTSTVKGIGQTVVGLGLILLALGLIRDNAEALRQSDVVALLIQLLENDPVLAIVLGGVLVMASFSSIAVVLLLVQLAAQGVMGLETAIYFLLGANIGAGILPILMTLGETGPGRLVVLSNFAARSVVAIAASVALYTTTFDISVYFAEVAFALLAIHLAINAGLATLMLPFLGAVLRGVARLTSTEEPMDLTMPVPHAIYLDDKDFKQPDRALSNCARELLRSGETAYEMLALTLDAFDRGSLVDDIRAKDEVVDALHRDITDYISRLMRTDLSKDQLSRARALFDFSTDLEHIGDIIDHNLMDIARNKNQSGVEFSEAGWRELCKLHSDLIHNFRLALDVMTYEDSARAEKLLRAKRKFRQKSVKSQTKHIVRLQDGLSDSQNSSVLHLDILRDFRRISSHLTSPAYTILHQQRAEPAGSE